MQGFGTGQGSLAMPEARLSRGIFGRRAPIPRRPEVRAPVYVEVSPLLTLHITGIGRFVARMVEALAKLTPLRLVTTINGAHAQNMSLSTDLQTGEEIAISAADLPAADEDVGRWAKRLLKRPHQQHDAELASRCAGIYTLLRPPARHFRREISVLYDFTPLIVPWAHVQETREHFGIFFSETSGLSDAAVAISKATKDDAQWLSPLPPEAVVAGYPGPSLCVHRHACAGRVERSRNIILVVSTLEPRKNGRLLLDWFLDTKALSPEMELWWVGPKGWLHEHSAETHLRASKKQVRFLGMVPDRELCKLYRRAAFAVYPSLYEGFGFPVLDALWHETPVVCAFNSSLQEFAGPGVHYFDACDPATLDDACRELFARGAGSVHRDDLCENYSWDKLARTVYAMCDGE
jgi:glycosyltransferase involved in cell wall biosynthesis